MRKSSIRYSVVCFLGFLCVAGNLCAQGDKNWPDLVNSEKAFAARATATNTRQAFLEFLDSTGVVFNEGKIENGVKVWTASPSTGGSLLWHPVFAGIAASGDLGFTTGPWRYKRALTTDTVLASGFYATIWRRNSKMEWKFLVDMGISCGDSLFKIVDVKKWTGSKTGIQTVTDVMKMEKAFIAAYEKEGNQSFSKFTDENSWFNINGDLPYTGKTQILLKGITSIPAGLTFVPVKGEMASSGDFGYVYGIVQHNGKDENYLRVWRNTKEGAFILLQVLNWK